jgi:hypothetical protein
MLPLITLEPVLVTVELARIANALALPREMHVGGGGGVPVVAATLVAPVRSAAVVTAAVEAAVEAAVVLADVEDACVTDVLEAVVDEAATLDEAPSEDALALVALLEHPLVALVEQPLVARLALLVGQPLDALFVGQSPTTS